MSFPKSSDRTRLDRMGPKEIGEYVSRLRLARGDTQEEIAYQAGISPNTYRKIETGKTSDPGVHVMLSIADVFGVSLLEILRNERELDDQDTPAFRALLRTPVGQSLTHSERRHLRAISQNEPYDERKIDVPYLYSYVVHMRGVLKPESLALAEEFNRELIPRPARRRGKRRSRE